MKAKNIFQCRTSQQMELGETLCEFKAINIIVKLVNKKFLASFLLYHFQLTHDYIITGTNFIVNSKSQLIR